MPAVSMTVNGKAVTGDVEARTLAGAIPARELAADRHPCRLRHLASAAPASFISTALRRSPAPCSLCSAKAPKSPPSRVWPSRMAPLHPMQEAFREHHGLQCGFCTPGMIMAALDIVRRRGNDLDEHTIREQLDGNICRCTGYHNIVKAIAAGAKAMARVARARPPNSLKNSKGGDAMSATGIGAAVRRKEDLRFITGKGQYTDDVVRPGETRAVFVRSPHAHAKIKTSTPPPPGRCRAWSMFHRQRTRHRQNRQSDLRLDDPFQGRHADEDGAAPGPGGRQGVPRRRRGCCRDCGEPGAGA